MDWNGKKVLVTGAGGFIGSHLVEKLLSLNAHVIAIVRYNSQNTVGNLRFLDENLKRNLKVFSLNLNYEYLMDELIDESQIIFNLAAHIGIPYSYINPQEVIENNIKSTLNILLLAKKHNVERLIQTSTSEVYGSAKQIPISETHTLQPQSPYSASKIATDNIALSFHYSFDLPVTIVRPFNTYGPRQSARAVIPTIISQCLKEKVVKLGTLKTTRDFTYVEDTVRGFLMLAESEKTIGGVFNLGTSQEITIEELFQKINKIIGEKSELIFDGSRVRPEKSEVARLCSDFSKTANIVGWKPEVLIDEGLKRTIEWVSDNLTIFNSKKYNL